ncbi:MAG: glycosyltransferase family 4 protein, partial [Patescibacteria group bacterium]
LYRQATIFVLPSTAEAQSIVSLEAAACGLPLVLANSRALPELISPDHPNGILFNPNDPLDLAAKIDLLLSNPLQLTKMGKNSRRLAETHNTKKTITDYEQTYLSLISDKK